MERLQVLLADDSATSRLIIGRLLRSQGFDVIEVDNGDDALRVLLSPDGPRLAILDWQMPGHSGVEICPRVRARSEQPYVYMLIVTAREDRQSLLEGLAAGADDYLVKPFDSEELAYRLRTGVRIIGLEDRLRRVQTRLEREATHDHLTGILNRGTILNTLLRELDLGRRKQRETTVLLADVDHFKSINDTHGHAVGDQVLQRVAEMIRGVTRSSDWVGRYGGEEFLVVLPETSRDRGVLLADRIRSAIATLPVVAAGRSVRVTLSIGVDSTGPDDLRAVERLIASADAAMYQAKFEGRDCVRDALDCAARNAFKDELLLSNT